VSPASVPSRLRFATPADADLEGVEAGIRAHFDAAVGALTEVGGERREIDYTAFREAGRLLYEGPFVAERHAAVGAFVEEHPNEVDPVVGGILRNAARHTASDLFASLHRLRALQARSQRVFEEIDLLVVPTIPRVFRIQEVQRRPLETNAELGRFNDFVNLLDLCACVIPVGMLDVGVPCGVTLIAPAFSEASLLRVATQLAQRLAPIPAPATRDARIELTVVGAHLRGMPLHGELLAHGAVFERTSATKPHYRLFSLVGTTPPKPGLSRVASGGAEIEVEVYSLPAAGFAQFVASVPAPLCIGRIDLSDGTSPSGFLCEAIGLAGARDITTSGGWRAWCAAR
jgi:allophanate hydrolase